MTAAEVQPSIGLGASGLQRVAYHAEAAAAAIAKRDAAVAVATSEGFSLRQIAAVAGVSHAQVARILSEQPRVEPVWPPAARSVPRSPA